MAPINTPIGTLERIAQGLGDPQAAARQVLREANANLGWLADAIYRGDRIDFDRVSLEVRREAARHMGRTYSGSPSQPAEDEDVVLGPCIRCCHPWHCHITRQGRCGLASCTCEEYLRSVLDRTQQR